MTGAADRSSHDHAASSRGTSRRAALWTAAFAGAAALTTVVLRGRGEAAADATPADASLADTVPAAADAAPGARYDFNQGWLFGGRYVSGSADPDYDDSGFAAVTLPHTVTPLSWSDWDAGVWENIWIYRKHFDAPLTAGAPPTPGAQPTPGAEPTPGAQPTPGAEPTPGAQPTPGAPPTPGLRVFADFDGIMTNATALVNGVTAGQHTGGYLPWSVELTPHLRPGRNVLAVIVDARWLPVPPSGSPRGAASVDYLQPGGIYRDAALRLVPDIFVNDVFAQPVSVLTASPGVQVEATIDAGTAPQESVRVTAELLDGDVALARTSTAVQIAEPGPVVAQLQLAGFGKVALWSPDTPKLYQVRVTVTRPGGRSHSMTVRTGFRDAVFRPDGFFLNGERLKIFGLNRHQLFPFTGMAAPPRLQRRDAEILRQELNCNMVRCSHYPQSPHFLDACDELGLMVWEEPPGWQYVGGAAWRQLVVGNVHDMVIRDRNRPSVIVWGTRLNETANRPFLYAKVRKLAYRLDGSRQTSGAMVRHSLAGWAEDVFGYDDYQRGKATLKPPLAGVPYLVSEAVGAIDGPPTFSWTDPPGVHAAQARMHAQVHSIAGGQDRYAGLLGWAGMDYASLNGGRRIWRNLKTPGVLDTFRVPKPGAAIYRSQVDPVMRPVVLPTFWWDFGPGSPATGPGPGTLIATNCDRLEIYVGDRHHATAIPDATHFGGLRYPPAVTDLTVDGSARPDLRVEGYLSGRHVTSLCMSADPAHDRLALEVADARIEADGSDATWLTMRATDAYGNHRPGVAGPVTLAVSGPVALVGDNPFDFGVSGGVGGAFLRSLPGRTGRVTVTAEHPVLGSAGTELTVGPPTVNRCFL